MPPSDRNPRLAVPDRGQRLKIPLSAPHQTGDEAAAVARVLETNWLASVGPEVTAFEEEFAQALGAPAALATASGTAAIHLAMRVLGIKAGDEVLVSTLTFCASVNPIIYQGARPVFMDSEARSWNMDPALLGDELERRAKAGRLPAAVLVVHLYGQLADMDAILAHCARWGVPVVEDAAEGLGAAMHAVAGRAARPAGTLGIMGAFSFDGSKMITTSVGGMLIADREALVTHARKLARQAREPVDHYEHTEIGYNYRMSNLLAAVGRAQLPALPQRVAARRAVSAAYAVGLAGVPGLTLQEEMPWGSHARWLSCVLVDPDRAGLDRTALMLALRARGVESRSVWKPMHQQPVYQAMGLETVGGAVADHLCAQGLCLPSSSSLPLDDVARVCELVREVVLSR
jgi:dTDP-4-amino-4,6-dideoxygalactose transaminase